MFLSLQNFMHGKKVTTGSQSIPMRIFKSWENLNGFRRKFFIAKYDFINWCCCVGRLVDCKEKLENNNKMSLSSVLSLDCKNYPPKKLILLQYFILIICSQSQSSKNGKISNFCRRATSQNSTFFTILQHCNCVI